MAISQVLCGRLSSNHATMECSWRQHIRDMIGYGAHPPHPQWPNGRLALNFVLNYEKARASFADGDGYSEMGSLSQAGRRARRRNRTNMAAVGLADPPPFRRHRLLVVRCERHPPSPGYCAGRYDVRCHGWRWSTMNSTPRRSARNHGATASAHSRPDRAGWLAARASIPGPRAEAFPTRCP